MMNVRREVRKQLTLAARLSLPVTDYYF